jgi:hypothetical protein
MGASCSSVVARQKNALLAAAVREKEKDALLAVAVREKEHAKEIGYLLAREKDALLAAAREKDALLAAAREKELLLLAAKDKEQLQEKLVGLQDAANRTRLVQLLRSAQKTRQYPSRADGGEQQYLLPTSPARATMRRPSPSLFGSAPLSPFSTPATLHPAVDGTIVQSTQQQHEAELFSKNAQNMELQQQLRAMQQQMQQQMQKMPQMQKTQPRVAAPHRLATPLAAKTVPSLADSGEAELQSCSTPLTQQGAHLLVLPSPDICPAF